MASENVGQRHISGRRDPVQDLLEEARHSWAAEGSPSALRRRLLEILGRLETDDDT
jgi:hypothetical protein